MKWKTVLRIMQMCLCGVLLFGCSTLIGCDSGEPDAKVFDDEMKRVKPDADTHLSFKTVGEGYDIYAPVQDGSGYRYGPSILYYPDGSIDAWFATPGTAGEWDWFTYKHSDDGGKTWSDEKVVLQPTPDSMDHYSVCDPGMIYLDGYYYLGYTSTIDSRGVNNNCFVARSPNPDGPFEKWNGEGWGGDPEPIVYYDEADASWGAGEPSFVEVDGTLYCYYTWACPEGNFEMVATADATDENWPATMEVQGIAYQKETDQDSLDVVYIEDYGKFLAVSTYNRFTENSGICVMESDDGITFQQVDIIRTGISQFCHNMGISKRSNGHIQLDDTLCFIGYAYAAGGSDSGYWGNWATRFQNIELIAYEGEIKRTDLNGKGTYRADYVWPAPTQDELWPIAISTNPHKVEIHLDYNPYNLELNWYDTMLQAHAITDAQNVKFSGYDTNIIAFDGLQILPQSVGKTNVTAEYKGCRIDFKVYIRDNDFEIDQPTPEIASFEPVWDEITVYKDAEDGIVHQKQIRGFVTFANETWGEAYNDSTLEHVNSPAMVPSEIYNMTFEVQDPSVIEVNEKGVITAKSVGETSVTVTITGGKRFTVHVTVLEQPET